MEKEFESLLEKLKNKIELFDLLTNNHNQDDKTKLLLKEKKQNMKLVMDATKDNHKDPHIHIGFGKDYHKASYSIERGERLNGELTNKYDRVIKDFIGENREALLKIWEQLRNGANIDKKHPLVAELKG